MNIGSNFPIIPQTNPNYTSRSQTSTVASQGESSGGSLLPSTIESFEQASSSDSARFFKVDGMSAFAQQAITAYQSTEALSPNNPRHQLIGIDVYA